MKSRVAMIVGAVPLVASGAVSAQYESTTEAGGTGGGMSADGGIWVAILVVVAVIIGLVAWVIRKKGK